MNSVNFLWMTTLFLPVAIVNGEKSKAVYPSNTAVISGSNFSFVCGTLSDGVIPQWKFRNETIYGELSLYNGTHIMEAFKDFAVVTTTKGLSTLSKNISKEADAGTYICIERNNSDSVPRISSAQLIVLGNHPVCKANKQRIMDGEFLEMECIVNYIGSISPVIKWSRSDGINPDFHGNISTVSSNYWDYYSSVVSKLTTQMTTEDNAVTFMSNLCFNESLSLNDKTSVHKATNAPNYEFIWTHKANVLYAPKSVNIAPKKDVYTIDDILYCVANGNPIPSYEWTELESTDIVSGLSSLTIDSIRMENRTYKCTATNDVSGKATMSISTTVTIHAVRRPSTGFDPVRDITIAAGVVFVILLLGISTVIFRRFKDRFRPTDLQEQQSASAQPEKQDRNPFHASATLDQSHQYESTEMFGMQEDRIVQPQNIDKPMESDNLTQPSSEEQDSSAEHQNLPTRVCTGYEKLGDHTSNPGPPIYERLNDNEPNIQEESTQVSIRTTFKAPLVQEGVWFEKDPTQEIYANATQVVPDGKYVNINNIWVE